METALLKQNSRKSRSLRLEILITFTSLLVLTVAVIEGYTYYKTKTAIEKLSRELIEQTFSTVIQKTKHFMMPAQVYVTQGALLVEDGVLELPDNPRLRNYAIDTLTSVDQLTMFNIADKDDNFLMPKKQPDDDAIDIKVINRNVEPPTGVWIRRSPQGLITAREPIAEVKYRPTERPWYIGASKQDKPYWTDMYILFTDKVPGITVAQRVLNPRGEVTGVLGLDIELSELSRFMKELTVVKGGGEVFIVDADDQVVAFKNALELRVPKGNTFRPKKVYELTEEPAVMVAYAEYQASGKDYFRFLHDKKWHLCSASTFPDDFGTDWTIIMFVPENYFLGETKNTHLTVLLYALIILILAVVLVTALSRKLTRPIVQLTRETRKIQKLDLDNHQHLTSHITEFQALADAVATMKTGLQAFKRYVPDMLVRQLIETGQEATLGGHKQDLTIMFTDIAFFSSIAEKMDPEHLMTHLSEYLDELTWILMDTQGTVDKYIGDAIMVFWGAPVADPHHAEHACRAALLCQEKVRALNQAWESQGKFPLPTRIGIQTGPTIVGNMGSKERMNYSVLGDTVNMASRLEGVNKVYGTSIAVGSATRAQAGEFFVFRPMDMVILKGKQKAVIIYELMGAADQLSDGLQALARECDRLFLLYLERQWKEALEGYEALHKTHPEDPLVKLYLERCRELLTHPPSNDWDGVHKLEHK